MLTLTCGSDSTMSGASIARVMSLSLSFLPNRARTNSSSLIGANLQQIATTVKLAVNYDSDIEINVTKKVSSYTKPNLAVTIFDRQWKEKWK